MPDLSALAAQRDFFLTNIRVVLRQQARFYEALAHAQTDEEYQAALVSIQESGDRLQIESAGLLGLKHYEFKGLPVGVRIG